MFVANQLGMAQLRWEIDMANNARVEGERLGEYLE